MAELLFRGHRIVVGKAPKNKVVDVKRIRDRIIVRKFEKGQDVLNVISAYASQVGLNDQTKREFWINLDDIIQGMGMSINEKLIIGGDFNGHVGKTIVNINGCRWLWL